MALFDAADDFSVQPDQSRQDHETAAALHNLATKYRVGAR
jgi:hypothetical protein